MSSTPRLRTADVAQLPEVVTFFGPHLTPPDLLNCIQVSRLWSEIFIPHLYHTLDDSKHSWPPILAKYDSEEAAGNKDEQWIRAIFTKYGHHVRHFCVSWTVLINCAFDVGTFTRLCSVSPTMVGMSSTVRQRLELMDRMNLSGLDGATTYAARMLVAAEGAQLSPLLAGAFKPVFADWRTVLEQQQDWETMQKLWLLIIHNNPGLRRLELSRTLRRLADVQDVECLYRILQNLPELTSFTNEYLPVVLDRLLDSCSNLRTFEFIFGTNNLDDCLFLQTTYPQLRSLKVDVSMRSRTFFTLLRHLPNLDALYCYGFVNEGDFGLDAAQILDSNNNRTPIKLRTLRLSCQSDRLNQLIANQVLSWLPNLIEFATDVLSTSIAQALVRHCPLLEVFDGTNEESLHENHANPPTEIDTARILLTGCPHLKSFNAIHHEISAEDMVNLPIVCHGLTKFRCQIRGVPRLTTVEQKVLAMHQGTESTTIPLITMSTPTTASGLPEDLLSKDELEAILRKQERSRNLQRRVFDRLASLTSLQTIDLGFEYRDLDIFFGHGSMGRTKSAQGDYDYGRPFPDTLELTLKSGFDRLATLTRLEVFGFESVDHRIGEPELTWMATAWPRLRVLRGIHEDKKMLRRVTIDVERKKELRMFMQALRSDVVHEAVELSND
ncbi:hypothetical protein BGX33_010496 [Mortierella sp. NVP41]|nr:hypothetical protein BGX33_010496 [Mortierella sp. NVP41]